MLSIFIFTGAVKGNTAAIYSFQSNSQTLQYFRHVNKWQHHTKHTLAVTCNVLWILGNHKRHAVDFDHSMSQWAKATLSDMMANYVIYVIFIIIAYEAARVYSEAWGPSDNNNNNNTVNHLIKIALITHLESLPHCYGKHIISYPPHNYPRQFSNWTNWGGTGGGFPSVKRQVTK